MIRLVDVTVRGQSDVGDFAGSFAFEPGLQVIAAPNHFGKSLAVTSIAWCFGLERMFGLQDNDASRFPVAVRDVIALAGQTDVPVRSSEASLTIERSDGARLRLTRPIKGDPSQVIVDELTAGSEVIRSSTLLARYHTMKDERGGLQRFLFEWIGIPRTRVMASNGEAQEIYLENIAPLFYIDQNEGWTDLQALQVYRYGLLEIAEIAVEYLLGAIDAVAARFAKQEVAARSDRLKGAAASIAQQVNGLFQRQGWITPWSDHGSVSDIAKRWSARSLVVTLREELNIDLGSQQTMLRERAEKLRAFLGTGSLDPRNSAPASDSSQAVVELKEQRHQRREQLRILRRQGSEQRELLDNLEHRRLAARDILRLKRDGIGRIDLIECPTCHRSIDPTTFELTSQSTESVQAHIDALDRDRMLVISNIQSVEAQAIRLDAELVSVEERLRDAERALDAVNRAVGAVREQLAKATTDLIAVERESDKITALGQDLRDLQIAIDHWVDQTKTVSLAPVHELDLQRRLNEFTSRLRRFLHALGHGEILAQPAAQVRLDDRYVPYIGPRRLRSLGSASDHPRLVAAYTLALAAASEAMKGLHPGFVILDEPLQQNPDKKHRDLFINFLASDFARATTVQTIVITWLHEDELQRLADAGVRLLNPSGEHFLELLPPPPPPPAPDDQTPVEGASDSASE